LKFILTTAVRTMALLTSVTCFMEKGSMRWWIVPTIMETGSTVSRRCWGRKQRQANGVYYSGRWKDNVPHDPHGQSSYNKLNSDWYKGSLVEGKYHGHGQLKYASSGAVYEGDFLNDQQHGHGRRTPNNLPQSYPEGHYEDGLPSGYGEQVDHMGTYKGHFYQGRYEGKGQLKFSNGFDVYEGDWENGLAHGEGVFTDYGIKTECSGEWEKGGRHGTFLCINFLTTASSIEAYENGKLLHRWAF
jgi:hypothetical protein